LSVSVRPGFGARNTVENGLNHGPILAYSKNKDIFEVKGIRVCESFQFSLFNGGNYISGIRVNFSAIVICPYRQREPRISITG
jgi:hypothetical protein